MTVEKLEVFMDYDYTDVVNNTPIDVCFKNPEHGVIWVNAMNSLFDVDKNKLTIKGELSRFDEYFRYNQGIQATLIDYLHPKEVEDVVKFLGSVYNIDITILEEK